jgi:glycosyltransferase involved in cell wall biosynthesis
MKIGYLMQSGVPDLQEVPLSGPAIHVKQVFKALIALGHEVRLVARDNGRILISDDLETFTPASATRFDRGIRRFLERGVRRVQSTLNLPYADYFESARFMRACQTALAGYDILYERMGWFGYGSSMAAQAMNVPHLLEVNGDHLTELETLGMAPTGLQRSLSIALMRQSIQKAAHIISAGDGWRGKFIAQWQTPPEKITTVENGSNVVDILAKDKLRAFSANTQGAVTIAFVGGFYPWQGLNLLLHSVAQTIDAGFDVQLILIGGGPQEAELRALIQERNISEKVCFAGHVSIQEMSRLLASADIGVSPYCGRAEFSGLKLLDYKSAGLAIVASGKDGQPAILEDGRTAIIVPPCDEAALANAIQQLIKDADLRKQLGQNARHEAEQLHSWRETAVQIEHILKRILSQETKS